uniref:Uncharacterized protein n=1 Tax=Chrysotila carterae TaxID=13221 RepID=A0A7S4EVD4_CHRCT
MGDAGLMWSPQFNYENGEPSHLLPGNRTFRRRARVAHSLRVSDAFFTSICTAHEVTRFTYKSSTCRMLAQCSTLLILANCFSTSAAARPVWREVTANGSWPQPRYSHTAAMSPSGEVLMFGGNMYDPTNDLYVFDLVRSEWSKVKAQGTPPAKRYGHTATVTSDGRMIVVGGFDGKHFLNDVHELSHVNGTYSWRSVPALGCAPSARDGHTATLAEGNRTLLIVGGFDGMRQLDDVHSLDLQSFEWRQLHCEQAKGERPAPRCLHAALPMDGGALLFGGYAVVDDESGDGDDVWFSDLWRLRLLQSEDMDSGDTQSEDLQGTGSDGTGSHGTGVASSAQSGGALQVVWERVEAVGASPPPLSGHALAADSRGRVWLFGGYAHGAFKNDLHVRRRSRASSAPRRAERALSWSRRGGLRDRACARRDGKRGFFMWRGLGTQSGCGRRVFERGFNQTQRSGREGEHVKAEKLTSRMPIAAILIIGELPRFFNGSFCGVKVLITVGQNA